MESLSPEAFNPHLKKVLKCYQEASIRGLSGPSSYVSAWDPSKLTPVELEQYRKALLLLDLKNKQQGERIMEFESVYRSPPFPIQQMPVFTPMDMSKSEKSDTVLEGENIACFVVGGEKRLCLPQILNTVLREFTLQQINQVCDELHIYCSRCNPEQLEILKLTGILPQKAPSCGLITKTDAERLCNALLHDTPEKSGEPPTNNSFRVYHECFGKCKGVFTPELYTSPHAKCIECCDCNGVFSPQKFVVHSHKALENRTCHWGFDSANWRSYLLLSKDQEHKDSLQDCLDEMKARFDFMGSAYKRKESPCSEKDFKRAKYEEPSVPSRERQTDLRMPVPWMEHARHMSAFRPWSPSVLNMLKEGKGLPAPPALMEGLRGVLPAYLHTGPPVLLNPERVVPHYDCKRYEPHFAPNVSLAPAAHKKIKVETEEQPECEEMPNDLLLSTTTDTEESGVSGPCTPTDEFPGKLGRPHCSSTLDVELNMLRMALDGKVIDKQKFIKEFRDVHMRTEHQMNDSIDKKKRLQQELEFLRISNKQKINELTEAKHSLKRELEHVKRDRDQQLKAAAETEEKMKQKIEDVTWQQTHKSEMKDEFNAKAHEQQIQRMRNEIAHLREELRRMGSAQSTNEKHRVMMSPKKSVLSRLESFDTQCISAQSSESSPRNRNSETKDCESSPRHRNTSDSGSSPRHRSCNTRDSTSPLAEQRQEHAV